MTLDELESELAWGFHDAYIERLAIDWTQAELLIAMRIMMSESQDLEQRAQIIIRGLVYCHIEAPDSKRAPVAHQPLWVDSETVRTDAAPADAFCHRFFVHDWNSSIFICAHRASLSWTDRAPVPARSRSRALFRGDSTP